MSIDLDSLETNIIISDDGNNITIIEGNSITITEQGIIGPAGPATVWGLIGGSIADQTDLKNQQDTQDSAIALNTAKTSNADHTGDATGDTALTLATVNSNVGSFTNASVTVNAKGLITAASSGTGGAGDMTKAVYDPTTIEANAFAMDNMVEGATTKIFSGTERTNLSNQSNTNTGDEAQATESASGIAEIATQAETDTATDDLKFITPLKLKQSKDIQAIGLISGCIAGMVVSINSGDSSKFDISAGTGIIIDYSVPTFPVITPITFAGVTAVTITNIATEIFTSLYVNSSGVVVQVGGALLTAQQRRQNISLDAVIHNNFTTITNIAVNSVQAYEASSALFDYVKKLGPINDGNRYSSGGANLTIDKASGTTTLPWINRGTDAQNPSESSNLAILPLLGVNWTAFFQDGAGGFTISPLKTAVDSDLWDDGTGTLAAVANNKYTIKRFYFFGQNNQTVSTYGQAEYSSLVAAESAIFSEDPAISPLLATGTFVTALAIKKGVTDLDSAVAGGTAKFINITSQTSAGGGGSVAQDLQDTYDLSAQPQIITDAVGLAFQVKQGSGSDTDKIYEGMNGAGSVTFSVDGAGNIAGNNLSGTNTGDQTSINGITGTKAQFDTAVTDGNITYDGDNVSVLSNDAGYITSNAVDTVNAQSGTVLLDADDISDAATTNKYTTAGEITKLTGIEALAEVNNISDTNATDLTDAGDSTLHFHSADRSRSNHTGTQLAATISDFDTEVSNNTSVTANTAKVSNANHTGDATGSTALTLATVNSNVGSFTGADITVNAKGLITAAANGVGEANTIDSDPSGVTGADQIINIMSLTQAEYTAIGTPNAATFYVITDA